MKPATAAVSTALKVIFEIVAPSGSLKTSLPVSVSSVSAGLLPQLHRFEGGHRVDSGLLGTFAQEAP